MKNVKGVEPVAKLEAQLQRDFAQRSTAHKQGIFAHIDQASIPEIDCEATGVQYEKIPAGEYDAVFVRWETTRLFSGKVYLWFRILPFYSEDINGKEIFMSFNAQVEKQGKNKPFKFKDRGDYARTWRALFGKPARKGRMPPSEFKNKVFLIEVGDVLTDKNQQDHSPANIYSKIIRVKDWIAGA